MKGKLIWRDEQGRFSVSPHVAVLAACELCGALTLLDEDECSGAYNRAAAGALEMECAGCTIRGRLSQRHSSVGICPSCDAPRALITGFINRATATEDTPQTDIC